MLMNTAIPSLDSQFPGATAPANAQGAGLINIYNAISAMVLVTPSKLLLRECTPFASILGCWSLNNAPSPCLNPWAVLGLLSAWAADLH